MLECKENSMWKTKKPNTLLWDEMNGFSAVMCYMPAASSQQSTSSKLLYVCLDVCLQSVFRIFISFFCFVLWFNFFILLHLLHGSFKSVLLLSVIPFWKLSVQVCFLLLLYYSWIYLEHSFIQCMMKTNSKWHMRIKDSVKKFFFSIFVLCFFLLLFTQFTVHSQKRKKIWFSRSFLPS